MSAIQDELRTVVSAAMQPLVDKVASLERAISDLGGERKELYTVAEAANLLSCCEQTVRRRINSMEIKAAYQGGKYLIPSSELRKYSAKSQ